MFLPGDGMPIGFESPWEHLRLLSDAGRNDALVRLLERRAPGATVAEIGCGTGLLSLVAARLGAKRVYAIEPTELWEVAAALVADNGLGDTIEVLEGRIEDLAPRAVDLAFSELLNADPFYEGVVSAMRAARRWTGKKGHLAPSRLRVNVALVEAGDGPREARSARAQIAGLGARFGLVLTGLHDLLSDPGSYRYFGTTDLPVSTSAVAWDLALGRGEPEEEVEVEVVPTRSGPVAGAVVWFEAELDDGLVMTNAPGRSDHWGRLVCTWADDTPVQEGVPVRLVLTVDDDEIDVARADG